MFVENERVEFKREYVDDIRKTVIAFANTVGGKIYIGVSDDGTICGVEDIDNTMLRITNNIRDSIKPDVTLFVKSEIEEIENKVIIKISVESGSACPYYLTNKGIRPEGVFVRQGASTVPASKTRILNMIKETSGERYETARSLNQELTFNYATEYFEKEKVAFNNAQQRTLKIIGDDNTYTNLALLLSEQCIQTIKVAVFEGTGKMVFKDRYEFTGSLLRQLEESLSFIDRYNSTKSEIRNYHRIDKRDYPNDAIREALFNSIVHRAYEFSASTLISIFDNRIEFVSIGGLIKGVSLDDILIGISSLRNPNLANVFYRLHLIEAYGTGIPKIIEAYEEFNGEPKIEFSSNAFRITLPNTNYFTSEEYMPDEREKIIIESIEEKKFIVRSDVERLLEVSQDTANVIIRNMLAKNFIKKEGQGRGIRYHL